MFLQNKPGQLAHVLLPLCLCAFVFALGGCINTLDVSGATTNGPGTQSSNGSATTFTQQAARASDFVDSVGVNTHFSYTDTPYYRQYFTTISLLQELGVRHVRDGFEYYWIAPDLYAIYSQLGAAGIHPDLVMPNPDTRLTGESMAELLPNYPGVDAIEDPNEYDQAGGAHWAQILLPFLPVIWQTSQLQAVAVIGPSLTQVNSYSELGDVSPYMTYANLHAYWGGRNPETGGWGGPDAQMNYYGSLPYDFDQLDIDSPGRAVFMTETGYVASNTPKQNVIPEWVEAVYEPRLLLHAWNEGILRTYIYELMDDPSSTPGFGLLRSDLSPRPAFTAVATLMGLLADKQTSFSPSWLTYSLSTATNIESTLLQKQDGSFWLALWNPGSIWDVNAVLSTPIASTQVTLRVPREMLIRQTWSFDDSGQASNTAVNARSVSLNIGSTVTLVNID